MPEIDLPLRIAVLKDTIKYAKKVGAYQAYDWLEHHIEYLKVQEHDKTGTRTENTSG